MLPNLSDSDRARFESKTPPLADGCQVWLGRCDKDGYGAFTASGKNHKAHRIAWFLDGRSIPNGMFILHHCDNPPCIRLDHLWLGTTADNVEDRVRKGRSATGNRAGAHLYPERLPHGDDHWTRAHPEKRLIGDRNGSRLHPESYPRGDDHYARAKPERLARGSHHGNALLTETDVHFIKSAHAAGIATQPALARAFGVSKSCIHAIIKGVNWGHIT